MIALKQFRYGGDIYRPGDEIEPKNSRDANVLRKTRLAKDEAATMADLAESIEKPRRRYMRRDMRAED